jgi:hypothetical protein
VGAHSYRTCLHPEERRDRALVSEQQRELRGWTGPVWLIRDLTYCTDCNTVLVVHEVRVVTPPEPADEENHLSDNRLESAMTTENNLTEVPGAVGVGDREFVAQEPATPTAEVAETEVTETEVSGGED